MGFCVVSVAGVPPGKDQDQVSGTLVLLSAKVMQVPWQKLVELAVKLATVAMLETVTS